MEHLTSTIRHTEISQYSIVNVSISINPLCDMNVFADMHLLMFMQTHTHIYTLFLSVFACAQLAERWGLSWCRDSCNE